MPNDLTSADLDAIEARHKTGTQGEWFKERGNDGWIVLARDARGTIICEVTGAVSNPDAIADADRIVADHADIPRLVTALRAAWAEIERVREEEREACEKACEAIANKAE